MVSDNLKRSSHNLSKILYNHNKPETVIGGNNNAVSEENFKYWISKFEEVMEQIPGHNKWADEFLAYVLNQKMDICQGIDDYSFDGDLGQDQIKKNKFLIKVAGQISQRLTKEIEN